MNDSRATDERPPYFSIEETVVDHYDLNPLAGWLYVVIVRHINRKKNDAFPSVSTLAKIAKMSKASVLRYTKELEDKHLIQVTRETDEETKEKSVNHYKLLSATRVVSDSNQGGDYVKPGVVSDSDINQKNINQKNLTEEQEIASASADAPALELVEKTPAPVEKVKRTGKAKEPPIPAAQINPMKDAIAAAFGWSWQTMTKNETGTIQAAAAQLCRAGRTPQDVPVIYRYCVNKGWSGFKPTALAGAASEALKHRIVRSAIPPDAFEAVPITINQFVRKPAQAGESTDVA